MFIINDHLEISASTSASVFKYKHCLVHNLKLALKLKVSSMYVICSENVIFSKVAAYCIKGIAVIPRRKFS